MILVTGATGFVGSKIMQMCKDAVSCPSLRGLSENDIRRIVEDSGADTIIHTAAISDIGVCQANPEDSYYANVLIPMFLAGASKDRKLICFSSDQVYSAADGEGPYTEDMVKPGNLYAEHKLEMEQRVLELAPESVMLRAEWMYDYISPKPNYFINVFNAEESVSFSSQQYRGITYVKEVAMNMEKVISLPGGCYNFGSETDKSMFEITQEFLAYLGKNVKLEDSPHRHNLWMNCDKAKKFGVEFQCVESGLRTCAQDYHILFQNV